MAFSPPLSHLQSQFHLIVSARHRVVEHHLILTVQQVIDFQGTLQPHVPYSKGTGNTHVVGVPWFLIILGRIGRRMVTFTHITETIVQSPISIYEVGSKRTIMPGDIGNLSPVGSHLRMIVRWIGIILSLLIGICSPYT